MSNVNSEALCLHIPELFNGNTVKLSWKIVDGATEYKLEACYDSMFGDVSSVGESWLCIDNQDNTWSQINAKSLDWQAIETAPESYAIFKGLGETAQSPEAGLTWMQIKNLSGIWEANDIKALKWSEISMLYTKGQTWDGIDAKHELFDRIDLNNKTWDDLEHEEPHVETHITCDVDIPIDIRNAVFRIRAFDADGNVLSSLQTGPITITASQTIKIQPLKETAIIQVEGIRVNTEYDVRYRLRYNTMLDSILRKKQHSDVDCAEELWTGLTALGSVTSKTEKSADLQFDWHYTN